MPVADAGRPPAQHPDYLQHLSDALLAADHRTAEGVLDQALSHGWQPDDVRLRLISPALHRIGDLWQSGSIGVADEHLATKICEWLLFAVAGRTARPPTSGGRAVVGCTEGEQHSVGAQMVANMLSERGWRVLYLGADTPVEAWATIVRARQPDLALLSTTVGELLDRTQLTLEVIRRARPDCLTIVGGQAYAGVPGGEVPADVVAASPEQLPEALLAHGR